MVKVSGNEVGIKQVKGGKNGKKRKLEGKEDEREVHVVTKKVKSKSKTSPSKPTGLIQKMLLQSINKQKEKPPRVPINPSSPIIIATPKQKDIKKKPTTDPPKPLKRTSSLFDSVSDSSSSGSDFFMKETKSKKPKTTKIHQNQSPQLELSSESNS
eukprot:TRINITY_DN5952_c0_g1_i1.p1 TRINITY_DN5952_c0_g1~~TRINITY_DN5952_c0_g1_i1.p1  ORF type:complete len:156 (+),score=59.98 TRINITY_DN5952_c0_g1_i1:390-857(+)